MSYDLGTAHGTIELDYEGGRAAEEADRDIRKVGDSSEKSDKKVSEFSQKLNKFAGFLSSAAKGAATAAIGISSMYNAVTLVAGALAVLAPIGAAAFAALPGLILGGVAAMAVFKIATSGVGEALKAASGDQDKFNEAIKNLSPQAQGFAKAVRSATQSLKPMQQAMQDAFFNKTGPEVGKITKALLTLRPEAVGVADGFNQVFRRVLEFASTAPAIEAVRSILKGVRQFLINMDGAIKPLLTGFANLAGQAGKFGGTLGDGLAVAMIKVGDFLNHVNLAEVFDKAMTVLKPLGTLLGNIASIAGSVFGGLSVDAGGALGIVSELVGQLAAFLKTASGQEALKALGEALSTISGSVGQVFLTLLQQLAPIIVQLAPGFADLAEQVANILVPALEKVGPILASVAGFLSDNMDIVGPLVIAIYAAVGAYKAFTAAKEAWIVVEKIAKSEQLASVGAWIASKAQVVASTAALVANKVAMVASTVSGWIANTAAVVANTVVLVASKVAMFAARAATIAWTAVQWLLNAALLANPIGLIIIAIVALIAIIVLIATKTTWFQDIWKVVWGGIKDAASAVGDWFANTLWPLIKGVWDFIKDLITAHVNSIKNTLSSIWGVVQKVMGFFASLRQSILDKIGEALDFIRGVPGRITDALGNVGSLLYNKGKDIVQSLINGIKNMFGSLKNVASDLVHTVTDFLPGSPAKMGPLSGKGWTPHRGKHLVEGLQAGMEGGLAKLEALSLRVATAAAPVLPSAVGIAGTSPSTIPMSTPAIQVPQSHSEASITIQTLNVNVRGVWDMNDPQASRKIAVDIHEAIEQVKREYR